MRVLHFLPVYAPAWQFGGPVLSVSRLCEGLAQHGVDVRVITTNAGLHDFPSRQLGVPQNVNGVQVTYYQVDQPGGVIRSRALVEALPEHMSWAELLHLSSIWQPLGIPVQKAAHKFGVPVIQSLRGALSPYSWRRGWWKKIPYYLLQERYYLQRAAALHFTALQEAKEISWLSLKPPIRLLPNPVDLSTLYCDPALGQAWRDRLGIPPRDPLLLVAGRMHHKKGLDLLPRALALISHAPWHIIFVGSDEDGTLSRLKHSFRKLGLAGRCHWLDGIPSSQLIAPYNAADLLLLPSRHENFGNVVIEALVCGAGAIVSDAVGVRDYLTTLPSVVTLTRNPKEWSEAILHALPHSRPGVRGAQSLQTRFSQTNIANEAIKMYESILTNNHHVPP